MLVAATGRDHFLDVLLDDEDTTSSIDATDNNGDTALHHAFQSTSLDPDALIGLRRELNLSIRTVQLQRFFKNAYPVTPAQEALAYQLVHAGADITIKNKDRIAPHYYASRSFKNLLFSASRCYAIICLSASDC